MKRTEKLSPRETLETLLGHLGFVFEIEEENRPSGYTLHIRTKTSARLIGRDGRTLEDLQYLLNQICHAEDEEASRVIVDVESYRLHEQNQLLKRVEEAVERVKTSGNPVELPPMNSFDRRIVHLAYKNHPDVQTVSPQGTDRFKSITIRKKG
jgi:spoIIIJ-associated protein